MCGTGRVGSHGASPVNSGTVRAKLGAVTSPQAGRLQEEEGITAPQKVALLQRLQPPGNRPGRSDQSAERMVTVASAVNPSPNARTLPLPATSRGKV